jgi:hypothetical protein
MASPPKPLSGPSIASAYDFPAEHWKHLRTSNPIEPLSPCATARSAQRAASRIRRRSPWCSSWSMRRRKAGAGSMAITSCPSSFKVSGSPMGSKSPPTQRPRNFKPPPPDPSGHHQDSAIAPRRLGQLQPAWSSPEWVGLATTLWQSAGRYPDAHGIYRRILLLPAHPGEDRFTHRQPPFRLCGRNSSRLHAHTCRSQYPSGSAQ